MKTITYPKVIPHFHAAGTVQTQPHFFSPAPGICTPLPKPRRINGIIYTHTVKWMLDKVEGCTRAQALKAIYAVLREPLGWKRAGVLFARTAQPARANILVRVIPSNSTVCGANAAGCWSWEPGQLPVAEVGVEYLNAPVSFATVLGMELCGHGTFMMADMYSPQHQPYAGSMGTWEQAAVTRGLPSDAEIEAARTWLAGKTPPEFLHDD